MTMETTTEKKTVEIPSVVVIKDLAKIFALPVTRVITELMKNGVMSSMNERIDYETAAIIAEELGFSATQKASDDGEHQQTISAELETLLSQDHPERQIVRPPVVVVMGHVDHGKTKLLDAIRQTNVVAGESGGITQHIGAYQVTISPQGETSSRPQGEIPPAASEGSRDDRAQGHTITFIDTPGHEAFTAMRSRGARVADIAILVVAADDGLKPQTKEAIRIIQQAQIPFVVAVNKIDKPEANIERVKKQLADENLLPEDWGGKVAILPVSALKGQGIDDLLETIVLLANLEEGNRKADPARAAVGSVIEAHIDKGEGPVATVIVRSGTLRRGDFIKIGDGTGKVKALHDWQGKTIEEAAPSQPAKILGLRQAPEVGDIVRVIDMAEAKQLRRRHKVRTERSDTSVVYRRKSEQQELDAPKEVQAIVNIVLRCDNLGSQEAILESLQKYESAPVHVEIVSKGLGSITEADVLHADTAKALLLGFHVVPTSRAIEVAKSKQIEIRTYTVIYDLLDDVREELERRLPVEILETVLGHLKILAVFRKEKQAMIVGGRILDGTIKTDGKARVLREGVVLSTGFVKEVQIEKRRVTEAKQGGECGIRYVGEPLIEIGDTVECFETEERRITLDEHSQR